MNNFTSLLRYCLLYFSKKNRMIRQLKNKVKTYFDSLESKLINPDFLYDFISRDDNQIIFDYGYNYFLLECKLVKYNETDVIRLRTYKLPDYPNVVTKNKIDDLDILVQNDSTRFRKFFIDDSFQIVNFSDQYLNQLHSYVSNNLETF